MLSGKLREKVQFSAVCEMNNLLLERIRMTCNCVGEAEGGFLFLKSDSSQSCSTFHISVIYFSTCHPPPVSLQCHRCSPPTKCQKRDR